MVAEFTAVNHYVPQWYQQQFIPEAKAERKYHYLDLSPDRVPKANGGFYLRNERRLLGPVNCFEQEHLYTLMFGSHASDVIEKRFFGKLDDRGAKAVLFFHEWEFNDQSQEMLHDLVDYLDAQKLRTPKGLDYVKRAARTGNHEETLRLMRRMWQMHVTIWMEGVWEILRCDDSPTKLIVTDHPVATYNKALFPLSPQCQYPLDAPIACLGTHTLFPLGPTRLLVITNLGYVRNPNANLTKPRENPRSFADTVFDLRKIQTGRQLSEDEVRAVNFILKRRARRYIAAAEREWLYPERSLKSTMWNKLGDQFFLMPDPRKVSFHTDTLIGFKDGGAWGVDEYGRLPGRDADTSVKKLRDQEWTTFHKHQKLWETKFGELTRDERRKYW
jgi:hypothetical protein